MDKEYYIANKEKVKEQIKNYRSTIMGRAVHLVSSYILQDKRRNFEKSVDFDGKWLVDNILTKPCKYCGRVDWHKLGCNRIDNSKPHTKDNVEPCCEECNISRLRKRRIHQYSLEGELIKIWDCIDDCVKETSFAKSCIQSRLRGKWYSSLRNKWYYGKEYKGYIWYNEPL